MQPATSSHSGELDTKIDGYFERRGDGQTIFYTTVQHRVGYLVSSSQREVLLRRYVRWRNRISTVVVIALAIGTLIGLVTIFPKYPWITTFGFIGCAGLLALTNRFFLDRAVAGLQPAQKSGAPVRNGRNFFVIAVGIALFVWALSSSYDPASRHPAPPGYTIFYQDISEPILGAVLLALIGLVKPSQKMVERYGSTRFRIAKIGGLALAALFGMVAIFAYLAPQAKIVLTPTELRCDGLRIAWRDISNITLKSDGSDRYAHLVLALSYFKLPPSIDDPERNGAIDCRVTGTSAGYEAVFDALRAAWLKGTNEPAS